MSVVNYNTKQDVFHVDTSVVKALVVVALFLVSVCTISIFLPPAGIPHTIVQTSTTSLSPSVSADQQNTVLPNSITGVITNGYTDAVPINPDQHMMVMLAINFNNQQDLNTYLTAVQNPASPQYHQFLTKQQFYEKFSPSPTVYNALVQYFQSQGLSTTTYTDRIAIQLQGTAGQFENVFHTHIMNVKVANKSFYAPTTTVSLQAPYTNQISFVDGLTNRYQAKISPLIAQSQALADTQSAALNTPQPTPAFSSNPNFCSQYLGYNATNNLTGFLKYCSNQLLVGSDLQAGYQLTQLYPSTHLNNAVIATILWTGQDPNLTQVAPFVPGDIYNYTKSTLPAGEPMPHVYGDPILNAPKPGPSAVNDNFGVNFESTLDLEMVGSMAPGANIIEVYGPGTNGSGQSNVLDAAFAEILNPASTNQTLNNLLTKVSVISNSWGGFDDPVLADVLWQQYSQEAAALGITVLASSGDNGNANGNGAGFPAVEAYNNYGTIAVGGTQTFVAGTASSDGSLTTGIVNQTAWYNTPQPFDGSQGGISLTYPEPSWQIDSPDANNVIHASEPLIFGRGTPDIAAVGSNMNITISYNVFNATTGAIIPSKSHVNRTLPIWGTSVASPLAAGVIAVIDNYLGHGEGFLAPMIYQLGEDQYNGLFNATPPFNDVSVGNNNFFNTLPGYDLVTGWGSINAYNFIMDQQSIKALVFSETGLPAGTVWSVTVNDLTLTSTANTITFLEPNGTFYYAIGPVDGYFSFTVSSYTTVNNANSLIPITFYASTTPGEGVNYVFSIVNASTAKISYNFGLPMSQGFITGLLYSVPVNYLSLYFNGTGDVYVSIGSFTWGTDVLSPLDVHVVSTQHWYTLTFPLVELRGGAEQYFINVQTASGNVQWGYADTVANPPEVAHNNGVNYNTYVGLYTYSAYNFDYAALYSLGLKSAPPTIVSAEYNNVTYKQGQTGNTITWYVSDTIPPWNYTITRNKGLISAGSWQVGIPITINVDGLNAGTYNYTIVVSDQAGALSWESIFVIVKGTGATPGFEFIPLVLGLLVLVPVLRRKKEKP